MTTHGKRRPSDQTRDGVNYDGGNNTPIVVDSSNPYNRPDDITFGVVAKNSRERIAVMHRIYQGHGFMDLRVMVDGKNGKPLFTAKSLAFHPRLLGEMIDLLQKAQAEMEADD